MVTFTEVQCPVCGAPALTRCSVIGGAHAARVREARALTLDEEPEAR